MRIEIGRSARTVIIFGVTHGIKKDTFDGVGKVDSGRIWHLRIELLGRFRSLLLIDSDKRDMESRYNEN